MLAISSFVVITVPVTVRAPAGQALAQAPQERHLLFPGAKGPPIGQEGAQAAQSMHRSSRFIRAGLKEIPSGLWHQWQFNGQKMKKTVVLMPGPSWVE
jgi:hypothetical protein